jgi:proline iminopeptidase
LIEHPLAELLTLEDGRAVEWEAVGDGPPLMWVEGGPGLWAHLARPDVELVSDVFRCHLVNAPGCGRTSPPADTSGYALPAIIAFFDAVRERLGLGPVIVMGHSWGDRLIVIDGYPGGALDDAGAGIDHDAVSAERERAYARHASEPWYDAAVLALAEEEGNEDWDEQTWISRFDPAWPMYFTDPSSPLAAPHLARVRAEVRMNMAISHAWFGHVHHFDDVDILPSLAGVSCPSLVIAGQDDFICGPAWNRPIAAAIPAARYVEIASAGHIPQYEQPGAFRAALLDWLAAT